MVMRGHPTMVMDLVIVALWLSLLSGCMGMVSPEPALQVTPPPAVTMRDRESEMAAMRADLAAARITAAKKEAELQELRQVVAQLRQENAEGHHTVIAVRKELEMRQAETERRQVEQVEGQQSRNAEAVSALERTVMALTTEVGQLKGQLSQMTSAAPVADAPLSVGSSMEKRAPRRARTDVTPAVSGTNAFGRGTGAVVPITVTGSASESLTQIMVQSGDTLWKIARRHRVSLAELRRGNRLDGDLVQAGQLLTIPTPSPIQP